MKAVVVREYAPFDRIGVGELPDPVPGKGEVVIDVKAAEVNYPDILVISGQYQVKPPLPFAPGKAATGGHGADVVIDPVGGAANAAALRAMAWRGRMVIIGFAGGEIPTIKANYLLVKNIEVSGLQWSDYRDRTPDWVRRVQTEIFALAVAGRLKPVISRRFPLEGFKDALSLLRDGKAQGKLILEVA
jgi:NADPH:quinone reductase-like Zn-dependent oxidoreductase